MCSRASALQYKYRYYPRCCLSRYVWLFLLARFSQILIIISIPFVQWIFQPPESIVLVVVPILFLSTLFNMGYVILIKISVCKEFKFRSSFGGSNGQDACLESGNQVPWPPIHDLPMYYIISGLLVVACYYDILNCWFDRPLLPSHACLN